MMKKTWINLALVTLLMVAIVPLNLMTTVVAAGGYDYISPLSEGLSRVTKDGKVGFIHKTGKEVIPPIYDGAESFSDGVAWVWNYYGEYNIDYGYQPRKYGLVDQSGNEIVPVIYDNAGPFIDGLAWLVFEGKVGYIDKSGKVIAPFKYGSVHKYWENTMYGVSFHQGLARVLDQDYVCWSSDTPGIDMGGCGFEGEGYGFIDKNGTEVIPPSYDLAGDFVEGRAFVVKDQKYGFIDSTGQEIVPLIYDYMEIDVFFNDEMALVSKYGQEGWSDAKFGYVNNKGLEAIPLIYDWGGNFYEGLAWVKKNRKVGFVNRNGDEIVPLIYDDAGHFSEGMVWVEKEGKKGFVDRSGSEVIPPIYDEVGDFIEGMAWVRKDNKEGAIDQLGREIIPLIYDVVFDFHEGSAVVVQNDKWGLADKSGDVFIPVIYDTETTTQKIVMSGNGYGRGMPVNAPLSLGRFSDDLLLVKQDGLYGYFDREGIEVIPFIYKNASNFSEGLAWMKENETWIIVDKSEKDIGDSEPGYIYDEDDLGTSLNLDYESLEQIRNSEDAIRLLNESVVTMTDAQKQSSTIIDKITHFAEEALLGATKIQVATSEITIDEAMTNELELNASETLASLKKVLTDSRIVSQRSIRTGAKVQTSSNNSLNITVDASVLDTQLDIIKVETPDFAVTLSMQAMKAELADGEPLIITLEPVAMASTTNNTVKVTFNKNNLQDTLKLSLPPVNGDTIYQAVVTDQGTPVTSKYNPATNRMEAWITSGGTYTVKQNITDFNDIHNKAQEMQDAIRYLASKGIVNGTSETTFNPDGSISRAEIAALVVRALGKLDPNADGEFADVTKNDWYFGAVGSAKRLGIINGYDNNTFRGGLAIPKAQIVAIAARTLQSKMGYSDPVNPSSYLYFSDKDDIASWAIDDVALATRENLVLKRTDNSFVADDSMTRGDAAIILKRMFDKIW